MPTQLRQRSNEVLISQAWVAAFVPHAHSEALLTQEVASFIHVLQPFESKFAAVQCICEPVHGHASVIGRHSL
jgi:hypothetical protein